MAILDVFVEVPPVVFDVVHRQFGALSYGHRLTLRDPDGTAVHIPCGFAMGDAGLPGSSVAQSREHAIRVKPGLDCVKVPLRATNPVGEQEVRDEHGELCRFDPHP